jgi:hypothetical protein
MMVKSVFFRNGRSILVVDDKGILGFVLSSTVFLGYSTPEATG